MFDIQSNVEKYALARENSIKTNPDGGLCGLEVEWNLLDSQFHPLLTVGAGPDQLSFVDYLRSECLSPRLRDYSQLEIFHWMIEWATRPYFHPRSAIFEARLMEAILINSLHKAGIEFNNRLYTWHGNLPFSTSVSYDSIPRSWHLAKRRYLERCVQLYGDSLATTGTHSNLSLPDALFEWDFMQLPAAKRTGDSTPPVHIDEYKSQFYITASRLMRAFASLFIATSASTPFRAGYEGDKPVVYLTEYDSVRNLTFPNPLSLDIPELYRSLEDYLNLSYDLVRQGIRFGNNNWTPVRARSFAEPVEGLIALTSEQLQELYTRGLFVLGQDQPLDDMVHQIEVQNLLARINLPMARVEVRTDDGGNPLEVEIANLTLKHLLLIRFYADPEFARSFRYDFDDIRRARKNEELTARYGLRVEIENPLTSKPVKMRDFLAWTLNEVQPIAELFDMENDLIPLKQMASGGPNNAEQLRERICAELGIKKDEVCEDLHVPLELLQCLAEDREKQVSQIVEHIAETYPVMREDSAKLGELLQYAREDVHQDPLVPIRFRPKPEALIEVPYADKTSEIIHLAKHLIEIPSITVGSQERLEEVRRTATFIYDYLKNHDVGVRYFDQGKYPAVMAGFPNQMEAPVMLSGHFDVVAPEPDDTQFIPRLEGDYLWGRGSADMKTVVATYLVWMKDQMKNNNAFPPINLLLVGNEETGEMEPSGTPHVLEQYEVDGYAPQLLIAGERTGENGDELLGDICIENRGVMRLEAVAHGQRGHTGVGLASQNVSERLSMTHAGIEDLLQRSLTLESGDGWRSQYHFPFTQIGEPGVYNIQAEYGVIGLEIRPIPQDRIAPLYEKLKTYCDSLELQLKVLVMEDGVSCDANNPYLVKLLQAVRNISKHEPKIGKKLAGTSARFAPYDQGIVWGQSGLNPHARDERHYIPSILPYYQALNEFGEILSSG
jgi:succinyl-diaminopimelate desuccinylase